MEVLLILFIAVAVLATAAVVFTVWAVFALIRGTVRLFMPSTYRDRSQAASATGAQVCTNLQCRCPNPLHARFCRRCGKSLPNLLRLTSSTRAA